MVNSVILIGRITNDLELKRTQSQTTYCNFSLAVTVKKLHKESGAWQEHTTFVPLVSWGKQAENLCKYCSKGSLISIDGELEENKYKNKEGIEVKTMKVKANNIQYIQTGEKKAQATQTEDEGDLPF